MKNVDEFYKTKRWKKLRESILRRDGYMCQECKRYGKAIPGTTVHHIFPREDFPKLQWEPWNLVLLCDKCHNEMHERKTNELTKRGMELLIRTARKRNFQIEKMKK